jgi:hypothetical protein
LTARPAMIHKPVATAGLGGGGQGSAAGIFPCRMGKLRKNFSELSRYRKIALDQ